MPTPRSWIRLGAQLAFRALFSLIFITAGAKHVLAPDAITARLLAAPGADVVAALASPRLLVMLSGAVLLAGGLALLTGTLTRWAALALAAVLVPITLSVQLGNPEGLGPLFKNVALFGGLLHFAVEGAGAFSVDAWLAPRVRWRPALWLSAGGLLLAGAAVPLLGTGTAHAESSRERILLLVQQPPQLKAALTTAQEALAGKGFAAREAEVLACGPAVMALQKSDPFEPKVAAAKRAGVRVVACGLTLKEKGISPEQLSPAVDVVENGLVEALHKQAAGFRSVEL